MNAPLVIVFSQPRIQQALPAFRRWVERVTAAVPRVLTVVIPHLYDLAPNGPAFALLRQLKADLILLAPLFPRAAQLVLRANGLRYRLARATLESEVPPHNTAELRLWAFDYREYLTPEPLVDAVAALVAELAPVAGSMPERAAEPQIREIPEPTRPRWYPVIDEERCTNCYECLNFCLFGVYDVGESGQVFTAQPDACRPGCPACARICPTEAIIFPLYPNPAIAGGDGQGGHQVPTRIEAGELGDSTNLREEAERWRAHFLGDNSSIDKPSELPFSASGRSSGPTPAGTDFQGATEETPAVSRPTPCEDEDDLIDRWLAEMETEADNRPDGPRISGL